MTVIPMDHLRNLVRRRATPVQFYRRLACRLRTSKKSVALTLLSILCSVEALPPIAYAQLAGDQYQR